MTITNPVWLPEMINMDGKWEQKIIELYNIFEKDFVIGKPFFNAFVVWWDRRVIDGNYPEGFWHIITRGAANKRIPDFRRSERLPWCGPSISHSNDPIIKVWDYQESKTIRTYLWLEDYDYVIILQKRNTKIGFVADLITAFHVDGNRTKLQLSTKYNQRVR